MSTDTCLGAPHDTRCVFVAQIMNGLPNSMGSDVYSFGVCMWEMATRRHFAPPLYRKGDEVKDNIIPPELPCILPMRIKDCIVSCLQIEPKKRPTFSEVLVELNNAGDDPTEGDISEESDGKAKVYDASRVDFSGRTAMAARLARLADFDNAECLADYSLARTRYESSQPSFARLPVSLFEVAAGGPADLFKASGAHLRLNSKVGDGGVNTLASRDAGGEGGGKEVSEEDEGTSAPLFSKKSTANSSSGLFSSICTARSMLGGSGSDRASTGMASVHSESQHSSWPTLV